MACRNNLILFAVFKLCKNERKTPDSTKFNGFEATPSLSNVLDASPFSKNGSSIIDTLSLAIFIPSLSFKTDSPACVFSAEKFGTKTDKNLPLHHF